MSFEFLPSCGQAVPSGPEASRCWFLFEGIGFWCGKVGGGGEREIFYFLQIDIPCRMDETKLGEGLLHYTQRRRTFLSLS